MALSKGRHDYRTCAAAVTPKERARRAATAELLLSSRLRSIASVATSFSRRGAPRVRESGRNLTPESLEGECVMSLQRPRIAKSGAVVPC